MLCGFSLPVRTDATVSCLFLVGTDSAFCSLDLVVISCLLLLVAVLGLSGLAGSAHFAVLGPWVTRGIVFALI